MNPLPIRGLDHVVIRTAALEPMLHFYTEVLGCALERALPPERGLYQLRAGEAMIDLVPVESEIGRRGGEAPDPMRRNMDHLCLALEHFDEAAIRAHLSDHGVEAGEVVTRYGALGEGPSLYIADPDGNTVELKGPPGDG